MTNAEVWIYVGQRATGTASKPKLNQFWMDLDGVIRGFKGGIAYGPTIGHQYEMDVERDESGVVTVHGKGRYIGHADHPDEPEWRAEDAADSARVESYRASKRVQREDPGMGGLQLDQLREQYQRLMTPSQRAGLLAAITEYVVR